MRKLAVAFVAGVFAFGAGERSANAEEAGSTDTGPTFTFGASTSYVFDFNDPDAPGNNRFTYSSLEQEESFSTSCNSASWASVAARATARRSTMET
jgi:hypothetical protein